MSSSTAAGGRVFTEQELIDTALDIIIEFYPRSFSSNDVRSLVRKHFGVLFLQDPHYISTAFHRAAQEGRIRRSGLVERAQQGPAKGRMVTTWFAN